VRGVLCEACEQGFASLHRLTRALNSCCEARFLWLFYDWWEHYSFVKLTGTTMYSSIVRRDRKRAVWLTKGEEPPEQSSAESSEADDSTLGDDDTATAPTQAPSSFR
jgi:hypothetical protein